jgi:hypothetical protein
VDADIQRLERKIDRLAKQLAENKKPFWVKASVITSLTGWDKTKMYQARENGYIRFEKREKGEGVHEWFYDLNSIHEKFIKH